MVYSDEDVARDDESARLKAQVDAIWSREVRLYREVASFEPGELVLEAGCGPGHVLARMQRELRVRVLGVELRRAALASASVPVVQADIYRLPCADNSVALAFSRLVFRHLERPHNALAELRRVVRPAGRVLLVDADDGMLTLYPQPDGWEHARVKTMDAIHARGGEPDMGRRLPGLLRDAGLEDVRVRVLSVTAEELGHRAFADTLIAPLLRAGDARECLDSLPKWSEGKPFASASLVIASGTVP